MQSTEVYPLTRPAILPWRMDSMEGCSNGKREESGTACQIFPFTVGGPMKICFISPTGMLATLEYLTRIPEDISSILHLMDDTNTHHSQHSLVY